MHPYLLILRGPDPTRDDHEMVGASGYQWIDVVVSVFNEIYEDQCTVHEIQLLLLSFPFLHGFIIVWHAKNRMRKLHEATPYILPSVIESWMDLMVDRTVSPVGVHFRPWWRLHRQTGAKRFQDFVGKWPILMICRWEMVICGDMMMVFIRFHAGGELLENLIDMFQTGRNMSN